ncbi:hypothetical protein [Sphaerisporangium dianthi]|uniref:Uncharacterized protein n=1 Tax=Sphaerisporangium dianthi TaxID=1436120 RepID=A0ABV9CQU9_9ACTN
MAYPGAGRQIPSQQEPPPPWPGQAAPEPFVQVPLPPDPFTLAPASPEPFVQAPVLPGRFAQASARPRPGAEPVVVDVGAGSKGKAVAAALVAGTLGVISLFSALTGQVEGGPATAFVAGVLGVVFIAAGLLPLVAWRTITRPRKLVIEQLGIRWDDPRGTSWAVAWAELSGVAVSRTVQRRFKLDDYLLPRKVMVRVDLFPADPGFRARHPEMEPLWELHRVQNGYRLPLGSGRRHIEPIDQGMRAHRPNIYLGVRDEGFMIGLI